MFVLDASPLIILASADHLDLLERFGGPLVVPERVRAETVDEGLAAGHADARRLQRAIDTGPLDVRETEETPLFERLIALDGLSEADASVIAQAGEHDAVAVMDERYGRGVADAEDVETRGTAYLVLSRVADGDLTAAAGQQVIDDLVDAGWYCSTDLYRRISNRLDEQ